MNSFKEKPVVLSVLPLTSNVIMGTHHGTQQETSFKGVQHKRRKEGKQVQPLLLTTPSKK